MSKGKRKANKQKTKKFVNDLIPPKNIKKIAIQTLENTKTQPNFRPKYQAPSLNFIFVPSCRY